MMPPPPSPPPPPPPPPTWPAPRAGLSDLPTRHTDGRARVKLSRELMVRLTLALSRHAPATPDTRPELRAPASPTWQLAGCLRSPARHPSLEQAPSGRPRGSCTPMESMIACSNVNSSGGVHSEPETLTIERMSAHFCSNHHNNAYNKAITSGCRLSSDTDTGAFTATAHSDGNWKSDLIEVEEVNSQAVIGSRLAALWLEHVNKVLARGHQNGLRSTLGCHQNHSLPPHVGQAEMIQLIKTLITNCTCCYGSVLSSLVYIVTTTTTTNNNNNTKNNHHHSCQGGYVEPSIELSCLVSIQPRAPNKTRPIYKSPEIALTHYRSQVYFRLETLQLYKLRNIDPDGSSILLRQNETRRKGSNSNNSSVILRLSNAEQANTTPLAHAHHQVVHIAQKQVRKVETRRKWSLKQKTNPVKPTPSEVSKCDSIFEQKTTSRASSLLGPSFTLDQTGPTEQNRTRVSYRKGKHWFNAHAIVWFLLLLLLGQPIGWLHQGHGRVSGLEQTSDSGDGDELSRAVLATMSTQAPQNDQTDNLTRAREPTSSKPLETLGQDNGAFQLGAAHKTTTLEEPTQSLLDKLLQFLGIFFMCAIMVGDICGNSLVILSVCRHSKLRVTTNWFVVSLACADILVALFAMTFNASVIISGRWLFSPWVCDFWNSCDVLASTASILHLCCISIDRYIAITRPLDYPMKITTRRVIYALCGVWISSTLLSYIPIFTGVYTTAEHIQWLNDNPDQCQFVVNRVYAIVSSSISFWIPACIMVFTYYRIYREATRQEKFIYKAQSMMPAPMANHHSSNHNANSCKSTNRSKQRRSKSMAVPSASGSSSNEARIKHLAKQQQDLHHPAKVRQTFDSPIIIATTNLNSSVSIPASVEPTPATPASSQLVLSELAAPAGEELRKTTALGGGSDLQVGALKSGAPDDSDSDDSNSGQSTPTKRSISKMKREHKAAKTLGIIMGVFILCWLPFFSWYTPMNICGHACDGIVPQGAITILFWIGYFNSTLNPIIYAYFNHEFRDAFKKTLQWVFCCCNDLKCFKCKNQPNDNQHYNCTYRSTQEIGLVNNS